LHRRFNIIFMGVFNKRLRIIAITNRRRDSNYFNYKEMKKNVTLDTLLAVSITILIACIGGYVNIRSVLADHEARLKAVENSTQVIINKLDKLQEQSTSILVKLEDKQDRKH